MPGGPTPGERFGPYDILGQLGAGGMGVVFRAKDTRLGREVALKTLPAESASDPTRLQRFEAEARAASALNHPNVMAVYDVGHEGGVPFLVTELLIGETLRERLTSGPLSPRKVIELGMQVAHGLAAVHEKGIVHRDLKPENLFLTKDGQTKILDFGVARTTEGSAATGTLTQSGAVMGTAGYMSPEQVRGRPADSRSDLFALGSILLESLTGTLAFPGETPVERGYAILNHDPKQPAELKAPPALLRVIHRCLEKDPEQRFQHARDLVFALEAITDSTGLPAMGGPSAASSAGRWPMIAMVFIALSIGLGAFAVRQALKEPPPEPVAPPTVEAPRPTSRRVSYRNGTIINARFTADGRGVAYAGAFDQAPARVYSGVLDGPQVRPASELGTRLFDVNDKDELALGTMPEETVAQNKGLILSRGSLAGGAPRALFDGVTFADFGPGDLMVLSRFVDGKFVIECPPGNVLVSSSELSTQARLSPDGTLIAYMRQPVPGDDRGTVEIIDRTGRPVAHSQSAWTLEGLAWHPSGKEVWFSAGYSDVARRIYALALTGTQREVFSAPGSLRILDIDAKGRVLAVSGFVRSRMFGKLNGADAERSLSWLDGSMPLDISDDGKALLFLEGFGPATTEVQTWLRRFDKEDDTPMLLATGWGRALSPDRRWAIVSPTAPFNTLRLVPTGAGIARDLPGHEFASINHVRFFPDGKRIAFSAFDRDNVPHLYVQSLFETGAETTGPPTQLTQDPLALAAAPSPDGKWLVGYDLKTRRASLVPTDGVSDKKLLEQLPVGDFPIQWSVDGKKLWVMRRPKNAAVGGLKMELFLFELATGKLTLAATIGPADPVGMEHIKQGVVTPDGRSYVYTINQELDELYLIENIR